MTTAQLIEHIEQLLNNSRIARKGRTIQLENPHGGQHFSAPTATVLPPLRIGQSAHAGHITIHAQHARTTLTVAQAWSMLNQLCDALELLEGQQCETRNHWM